MKYIDGVLAPGTIKTGTYLMAGRAYYVVGNFVGILTPAIAGDFQLLDFRWAPSL